MSVYLVTRDCYFAQGIICACQQHNVEVKQIPLEAIQTLSSIYPQNERDTLILALDEFQGRFWDFIDFVQVLKNLSVKTILVSDGKYNLQHIGGYLLNKNSPLLKYLDIIHSCHQSYFKFIKYLQLGARDIFVLKAFYNGLSTRQIAELMGGISSKNVSVYKTLALRKLGVRRFNHLYQIF